MLRIIDSTGCNPYWNLALEESLFCSVEKTGDAILYLWQNDNTVVIGRNQNTYTEIDMDYARQQRCRIVRRLTGGGAVYHDLGNLNYTIIVPKLLYDIKATTTLIEDAISSCGISVTQSGRNDILADGRKFSGNAFYSTDFAGMHHGTIMIDVDLAHMERLFALPVGKNAGKTYGKVYGKGIRSVKSRVINLKQLKPDITCESIKRALENTFVSRYADNSEVKYGLQDNEIEMARLLYEKYRSDKWNLEQVKEYSIKYQRQYFWGYAELTFDMDGEKTKNVSLISDSLYPDIIDQFQSLLIQGKRTELTRLKNKYASDAMERIVADDLIRLCEEAFAMREGR